MNNERSRKVELFFSEKEYEVIDLRAKAWGQTIEEFGRFCIRNARINIEVGADPTSTHLFNLEKMLNKGLINESDFEVIKNKIVEGNGTRALIELEKKGVK